MNGRQKRDSLESRDRRPRAVTPAPPSPVMDGRFQFGTFNTPFMFVNMLDGPGIFTVPVPAWFKRLRLKEWEAFQVGNRGVFVLGAVYNIRWKRLLVLVIHDIPSGTGTQYLLECAPFRMRLGNGMKESVSQCRSGGARLRIENRLAENRIHVEGIIPATGGRPPVTLSVRFRHVTEPIVICQPFADNRALYSHKALMPAEGHLIAGDRRILFREEDTFAIIDDHKGFYPYRMTYDWVTGAVRSPEKGLLGFNLTRNQVRRPEAYNENCLWLDGKMIPLPPVRFNRTREGGQEVWTVRDDGGSVHVDFHPRWEIAERRNFILARIDYRAPFGRFSGWIRFGEREKVSVDACFGMGERKRFRL